MQFLLIRLYFFSLLSLNISSPLVIHINIQCNLLSRSRSILYMNFFILQFVWTVWGDSVAVLPNLQSFLVIFYSEKWSDERTSPNKMKRKQNWNFGGWLSIYFVAVERFRALFCIHNRIECLSFALFVHFWNKHKSLNSFNFFAYKREIHNSMSILLCVFSSLLLFFCSRRFFFRMLMLSHHLFFSCVFRRNTFESVRESVSAT